MWFRKIFSLDLWQSTIEGSWKRAVYREQNPACTPRLVVLLSRFTRGRLCLSRYQYIQSNYDSENTHGSQEPQISRNAESSLHKVVSQTNNIDHFFLFFTFFCSSHFPVETIDTGSLPI